MSKFLIVYPILLGKTTSNGASFVFDQFAVRSDLLAEDSSSSDDRVVALTRDARNRAIGNERLVFNLSSKEVEVLQVAAAFDGSEGVLRSLDAGSESADMGSSDARFEFCNNV